MDLARLRNVGYTVAPGVVGAELIGPLLAALRDVGGIDVEDPATWPGKRTQVAMGGHQAQWDVRQHAGVHAAFAELYGDERLAVSQDRLGVKLPGEGPLGIHLDEDPATGPRVFGGLVYLTDAPAERGAFCCVPSLLGTREGFGSPPDLDGHEVVPVPGRAGDLVLWDIRLPHGNMPNRDSAPRVVQYVSMFPHGTWRDTPEGHQALWREGRDWQDEHGPPGHVPAELTPLGRRLVGLDPYG
jgi:hypothetical protein